MVLEIHSEHDLRDTDIHKGFIDKQNMGHFFKIYHVLIILNAHQAKLQGHFKTIEWKGGCNMLLAAP